MRTDYQFIRKSKSIQEWFESLPTPYSLSEVDRSDKIYEQLLKINDL